MPALPTRNSIRRLASFRCTKLVVIQSLGTGDVRTGEILQGYLSTLDSFVANGTQLEIHDCSSKVQLTTLLETLLKEATEQHSFPILHFECHGSDEGDGLVLASEERMTWEELGSLLTKLNLATEFNLLVFFAACNAFYFIEEMEAIRPAPVYAMVAPSDEVSPAEVMGGTRIYYRALFDSADAGLALRTLRAEKLEQGQWFGKTAEEWFEEVLVNYVIANCSSKEIANRAQRMYQQQPTAGPRMSVGALKRGLYKKHASFSDEYFNQCFHTSEVPSNVQRFAALRTRVEQRVKAIRNQKSFRL